MKRLHPLLWLTLGFTMIVAPVARAAAAPAVAADDRSSVLPVVAAISTVTGIAISPLLGMGAYGAYRWIEAGDEAARAALPWYAQWTFFGPALLLVGLCAAKDALGAAVPPALKKPLDVLELVENKLSGLVAAGAIVPFTMMGLSKLIAGGKTAAVGAALVPSGLAMVQVGVLDGSWLLNLLLVPLGIALFAMVWMASHAINVLIVLSPWGAIDAALKGARTALLGLLALAAAVNPWAGALVSLAVIVVAYCVAGWAFRLTTFGTIFSWGYLTRRSGRFSPGENDNWMFAGGNLPGVPVRTYGRLVERTAGGLEFFYRPWLVLPVRTARVPASVLCVGRGLFLSSIMAEGGDTYFLLPPRYRGHEEEIARAYRFAGGVRDAGLRKAWSAMRELFGGAAARTHYS